jgi:hypothetical protein
VVFSDLEGFNAKHRVVLPALGLHGECHHPAHDGTAQVAHAGALLADGVDDFLGFLSRGFN